MSEELQKINDHLIEILSKESGYFGRVDTRGQGSTKYDQIGYVLSEDFMPTLVALSDDKRKNLVMVMTYFEMHARPLKNLLNFEETEHLYKFYSDIAWSHFATVIMFGMLEFVVKGERGIWLQSKGSKMKQFLEDNLPEATKVSIAKRYKVDKLFKSKPITDFGSVVDHLWGNIRGGFVHDAGIESKGLEWSTLSGVGTKENPININQDVPIQELLQITWQAILNSYGYKGSLELPRRSRTSGTNVVRK